MVLMFNVSMHLVHYSEEIYYKCVLIQSTIFLICVVAFDVAILFALTP